MDLGLSPDLAFSRSSRSVSWLRVRPMGTAGEGPGWVGVRRDSSSDDAGAGGEGPGSPGAPGPSTLETGSEPAWSMMVPWAATGVVEAVAPVKRP